MHLHSPILCSFPLSILFHLTFPRRPYHTGPEMAESYPSSASAATNGGDPPILAKTSNTLSKAFSKVDLTGHNLPPSPAPSTPRTGRTYSLATELVYTEGSDQYKSSSMPIYQVSKMAHFLGLHFPSTRISYLCFEKKLNFTISV